VPLILPRKVSSILFPHLEHFIRYWFLINYLKLIVFFSGWKNVNGVWGAS